MMVTIEGDYIVTPCESDVVIIHSFVVNTGVNPSYYLSPIAIMTVYTSFRR